MKTLFAMLGRWHSVQWERTANLIWSLWKGLGCGPGNASCPLIFDPFSAVAGFFLLVLGGSIFSQIHRRGYSVPMYKEWCRKPLWWGDSHKQRTVTASLGDKNDWYPNLNPPILSWTHRVYLFWLPSAWLHQHIWNEPFRRWCTDLFPSSLH